MVDITEISAVVAAAGVLVGVVYYILDMRHQRQVRQSDMVIRLYNTFGSTEFAKSYQKVHSLELEDFAGYLKKYGTDPEVYAAMVNVGVFFEGIGLLAKRKLIDMSLVHDLFSSIVRLTWEKMAPIFKGRREQLKAPSYGEWFEYLYNELKKREQLASKTA